MKTVVVMPAGQCLPKLDPTFGDIEGIALTDAGRLAWRRAFTQALRSRPHHIVVIVDEDACMTLANKAADRAVTAGVTVTFAGDMSLVNTALQSFPRARPLAI